MSIPKDGYIGEPGYPAPWTTSAPREGLRDTDQARIISLSPDVCRSPKTPIPYPVVDFCGHDENYTPSVRFTGQKAMVMRSNTSHVHGDEAGRGRGVVSNTVGGISEPITHAAEVRAEGSHVIRHLDRFYMNNRNTVGEAVFVRDTATYPAPQDDDPLPGSMVATAMPFEPYQVAQAATGTVSDAGGWGRTAPQPAPQTQSRPQSGTGLRRRGILGALLAEINRDLTMTAEEKAVEWRAVQVIHSPAGAEMIRRHRLLGGQQPIGNPLDLFDATTWQGKYGLTIGAEDRIPLANDILGHLTGHPQDVRELTDDELHAMLAATAQRAETDAGTGVRVSATGTETHEVECFEVSDRYNRNEYREQLKKQEEELNEMSPEEYLERRRAYKEGETVRSSAEARQARNEWIDSRVEQLRQEGHGRSDARNIANDEARGLAALHALDLVAGGADRIWRMGHRGINSSIGSKWIKKGRLDKLDDYAERIRGRQEKMDVELEDC